MYPLNPLEIISKVVKILNHSRHKIDFIASGLDILLYLYIKTTIEFIIKIRTRYLAKFQCTSALLKNTVKFWGSIKTTRPRIRFRFSMSKWILNLLFNLLRYTYTRNLIFHSFFENNFKNWFSKNNTIIILKIYITVKH